MTRDEFNKIFKNIENEYSNFNGDYEEWYEVLADYSYEDILKKLEGRKTTTAPIHTSLIKGLKKEEKIADWITECDICKQRITIHNNDMTDYEKHYRRCSKIDFINLMSKRIRGEGVALSKYYEMNDKDLDEAYRKVMDFYKQQPKTDIIKKI